MKQLFDLTALEKRISFMLDQDNTYNTDNTVRNPTRIEVKMVELVVRSLKAMQATSGSHIIKIEAQDMNDDGIQECIRAALSEISHKLPKRLPKDQAGRGAFGVVYRIPAVALDDDVKGHKLDLAVKIVDLSSKWRWSEEEMIKNWQKETEYATKAGALDIGPRMLSNAICVVDGAMLGVSVMEYVSGLDMYEYLDVCSKRNAKRALSMAREKMTKLHDAGIFHSDAHFGNMRVEMHGKNQIKRVFIIDYGLSKTTDDFRSYDMEALNSYEKDIDGLYVRIAARLLREGSFK